MASKLSSFLSLFLLLSTSHSVIALLPDLGGAGDNLGNVITTLIPNERNTPATTRRPRERRKCVTCVVYDGSYMTGILDMLSGWRVSPGDVGDALRLGDLGVELDSGNLFGGDFLNSVARQFTDGFDSTVDGVTGLFDGEQSSFTDFLRSPVDKFKEHFGFTKKCSGPGFICGEKIPDACVGPSYSFVIDGGVCILDEDSGEVVCSQPSVSIVKIPATCNLKYDESTTVLGRSCVEKREFGEKVAKTIGKKARTLNIGAGDPYQFLELDDLPLDLDVFFNDILS